MMERFFERFATKSAQALGSFWAFTICVTSIVVWLILGPIMGFSDSWQLYCNTVSTILTTLVVLIIQNTVNRGDKSLHIKLDELLRVKEEARTELVDLENMPEADMNRLLEEFQRLRAQHQKGNRP